ncbi:hypothetical protein J8I26_09485 [Herbaspirillum sp. LeCh32-8]|uniref:hypothetical protein n=1 Tax=Herbaspirillum sp. LeCh32-8 TaxID=2821356 RepID=UPI001AE24A2A|nr:hypothetical protein [Herbaspirillum sp. LeCh32-8]MBP0598335.1 hypothetical protein [Herbaspirillum sp. LeCh32-8]
MTYVARTFRLLAIAGVSLVAACTHAPRNKAEIPQQDPAMSTIYLYRAALTAARAQPFYVSLDGKPVTPLTNGSYVALNVPPGDHRVVVSPGPYGYNRGARLKTVAGGSYFYQFEFKTGDDPRHFAETTLSARDEQVARADIGSLRRALANFNDRRLTYARTNYASVSDVDAVPALNARGREVYQNWLRQRLPRAFVVASNGAWYGTWGMGVIDIPGLSDPATRAMQRCAARMDVICQVYAINNSVVWRPLPKEMVQNERQRKAAAAAPSAAVTAPESAEAVGGEDESKLQQPQVRLIAPIFSQLMMLSLPPGFKPGFEQANSASYIRESVPLDESVNRWTQMVTVTGVRNMARSTEVTPEGFGNKIAEGFRSSCPGSYAGKVLSSGMVNGREEHVFVASCGKRTTAYGTVSETAMIQVIKGRADYYTVQWAERGEASETPLPVDVAKWLDRYNGLAPVKLCERVPGEKPPYPSCVNGKGSGGGTAV